MSRGRRAAGRLAVVVLLVAAGCILTSGQILVTTDLGDFNVTTATVARIDIDLNGISDYTTTRKS